MRDRAYLRKMRAKHIRRKKRITSHYPGSDRFPYYAFDGAYSKNKIHCSCRICRGKDYRGRHILTLQERRALERMKVDRQEEERAAEWSYSQEVL